MNMFKMLGNLGHLAKIQEDLQAVAQEQERQRYQGKAGGGMVVVTVDGAQKVLACSIDPALSTDDDRELIEELVVAAVNDALEEARRKHVETVQKMMAERLGVPGMGDLLGSLLPKPP